MLNVSRRSLELKADKFNKRYERTTRKKAEGSGKEEVKIGWYVGAK